MNPKVSIIIPVYNVEEYINTMLESVLNQSFKDYEALIINDGSTDGSQAIIDKFCKADSRFHSEIKENGGVASARNLGIDIAKGEYVVFYDPDDFIPKNALEEMYKSGKKAGADMVIGVMEEVNLGVKRIYMNSKILARQKNISPSDSHFLGAWSLCNKMFSLKFIKDNNLRIEPVKYAEDGVFTFNSLNHDPVITGADVVSYNYIRRPFWNGPSATQVITAAYMEELFKSHNRILEESKSLVKKYLSPEEGKEYIEKLYERFIDVEMLDGYYRSAWNGDKDFIKALTDKIEEYRQHISKDKWENILKKHKDLRLDNGYITYETLADNPEVSVAISGDLSKDELNLALGSLYNQGYIFFEVLVPEEYRDMVEETYANKRNLRFVNTTKDKKNSLLKDVKGQYVLFLNEPVIYTKTTIKQLRDSLRGKSNRDFAAMLYKNYDGNDFNEIKSIEAVFSYGKKNKTAISPINYCDSLFSNKLIRKDALKDFTFTECDSKDVNTLYDTKPFIKLRKGFMLTKVSEADLELSYKGKVSNKVINSKYKKSKLIGNFIEKVKSKLTREDINKIKKLLGKK